MSSVLVRFYRKQQEWNFIKSKQWVCSLFSAWIKVHCNLQMYTSFKCMDGLLQKSLLATNITWWVLRGYCRRLRKPNDAWWERWLRRGVDTPSASALVCGVDTLPASVLRRGVDALLASPLLSALLLSLSYSTVFKIRMEQIKPRKKGFAFEHEHLPINYYNFLEHHRQVCLLRLWLAMCSISSMFMYKVSICLISVILMYKYVCQKCHNQQLPLITRCSLHRLLTLSRMSNIHQI